MTKIANLYLPKAAYKENGISHNLTATSELNHPLPNNSGYEHVKINLGWYQDKPLQQSLQRLKVEEPLLNFRHN